MFTGYLSGILRFLDSGIPVPVAILAAANRFTPPTSRPSFLNAPTKDNPKFLAASGGNLFELLAWANGFLLVNHHQGVAPAETKIVQSSGQSVQITCTRDTIARNGIKPGT